jgi:hypothetical protein
MTTQGGAPWTTFSPDFYSTANAKSINKTDFTLGITSNYLL